MIIDKKLTLRPILESSEGIHLTAYLVNRGDVVDLKSQLRETLNEAYEWLHPVQSTEERKRFLEPLDALLKDARIFKGMKGNIGIFRTKDSFRVLNVPVEIERQCHVASSFHVKPLLRWMQSDREFLLLGLSQNSAHLYLGSRTSLQKIDSILFPEFLKPRQALDEDTSSKTSREFRIKQDETFAWLSNWLEQMTKKSTPRLFFAGEKELVDRLLKNLQYTNVIKTPVAPTFGEHSLMEVCTFIRELMIDEAKKTLQRALLEFRIAEEMNLAKKNIFQIAKAVMQGRVKKLIVADGMNIFGKVDKKTGGLAIHPFDLDHEDDDILDDLAQAVLAFGGEVVVASIDQLPKGRPVLAILDDQGSETKKATEFEDHESFKERVSV